MLWALASKFAPTSRRCRRELGRLAHTLSVIGRLDTFIWRSFGGRQRGNAATNHPTNHPTQPSRLITPPTTQPPNEPPHPTPPRRRTARWRRAKTYMRQRHTDKQTHHITHACLYGDTQRRQQSRRALRWAGCARTWDWAFRDLRRSSGGAAAKHCAVTHEPRADAWQRHTNNADDTKALCLRP